MSLEDSVQTLFIRGGFHAVESLLIIEGNAEFRSSGIRRS